MKEGENKPFNLPICDITANYCKIFENMGEGVSIFDIMYDENKRVVDLRVDYINPASIFNKFEFRDEVTGKTITELFDADKIVLYLEMANKVISTGKGIRYETYFVQLNRQFLVNIFSPHKDICIAVDVDITREKEVERKLKESEKRYRRLLENSFDAVVIHSEGKIISANNTAADLLGVESPETLINKPLLDLVHPDYRKIVVGRVNEMLGNGKLVPLIEEKFLNSNGKSIDVEVLATPFIYNGKKAVQVVFRDISDRKKAQKKLREANDTLELKVQERTKELRKYKNQLESAITELKRSNEELQQFAYITSHDLQEPLRTIASFTQLIERRYKSQLDQDADEYIEFIVDAAVRMKEMIQGLLEYSRIGAKKGELTPTDVEVVLRTVLDNLHIAIEENNAEITHDPLPTVIADKTQLIQLFQNLIGNAIKFKKPEIQPKIHVSCQEMDKEYTFSVSDNGIGLEPQYKNKIFEVFKRLHTIDKYDGAGIGLAISKRIVERHGGRIWVESEYNAGSVFYFTLSKP